MNCIVLVGNIHSYSYSYSYSYTVHLWKTYDDCSIANYSQQATPTYKKEAMYVKECLRCVDLKTIHDYFFELSKETLYAYTPPDMHAAIRTVV